MPVLQELPFFFYSQIHSSLFFHKLWFDYIREKDHAEKD